MERAVQKLVTVHAGLVIGGVLLGLSYVNRESLILKWHFFRFRQDARSFLTALEAPVTSLERRAIGPFVRTRAGRDVLRECFVEEALATCWWPRYRPPRLSGLATDEEIVIEIRNSKSSPRYFSYETSYPGAFCGSVMYTDLDLLTSRLLQVFYEDDTGYFALKQYAGVYFRIRRDDEKTLLVAWKPPPLVELIDGLTCSDEEQAVRSLYYLWDLGSNADAGAPSREWILAQSRTQWPDRSWGKALSQAPERKP
jgi:hypothetical protein